MDTKTLKNRIKSVDSTLHLTKAMGLVASAKIRGALEKMNTSITYLNAVRKIVEELTPLNECKKSVYMQKNRKGVQGIVVIAGDRGLAGGYNSNVFKVLEEYQSAQKYAIGKRICEKYNTEVIETESFEYFDAVSIAKKLCLDFVEEKINRIGIIYTKYESMMSAVASIKWVLPFEEVQKAKTPSILFEPDAISVFDAIIPEYIAAEIYAAVRESFASEVAARRLAMDSAGKNAAKMIDDMLLEYNRLRQTAITQEITEIIAGS